MAFLFGLVHRTALQKIVMALPCMEAVATHYQRYEFDMQFPPGRGWIRAVSPIISDISD